ncbi:small subunit ribosomal protein S21 [Algoriphagus alkaliphilus]|uniref:Small ribosomal subunit protein bS21 n=2 Tax=Cyclobacteriaceae TaxID=563798 RepID=A0A1G5YQQ4_9BACT|nr:small subunit ribosomal protein S21 [Algoriphagus alkaliphilus]
MQPRKGVYTMIIVNVKENESIEKALKRFKKKFDKTGAVRELRARQAFTKPSIVRRAQVIKAAYKQQLRNEEMK